MFLQYFFSNSETRKASRRVNSQQVLEYSSDSSAGMRLSIPTVVVQSDGGSLSSNYGSAHMVNDASSSPYASAALVFDADSSTDDASITQANVVIREVPRTPHQHLHSDEDSLDSGSSREINRRPLLPTNHLGSWYGAEERPSDISSVGYQISTASSISSNLAEEGDAPDDNDDMTELCGSPGIVLLIIFPCRVQLVYYYSKIHDYS